MLKIKFNGKTKKVKASETFVETVERVKKNFPALKSKEFRMHYMAENDYITLIDDKDIIKMIKEAVNISPNKTAKLLITLADEQENSLIIYESLKEFGMSTVSNVQSSAPKKSKRSSVEESKEVFKSHSLELEHSASLPFVNQVESEEVESDSDEENKSNESEYVMNESVVLSRPMLPGLEIGKAQPFVFSTNQGTESYYPDMDPEENPQPSLPQTQMFKYSEYPILYPQQISQKKDEAPYVVDTDAGKEKAPEQAPVVVVIPEDKELLKRLRLALKMEDSKEIEEIKKLLFIRLQMDKEFKITMRAQRLFVLRFKKENLSMIFSEGDQQRLAKLEEWWLKKRSAIQRKERLANDKQAHPKTEKQTHGISPKKKHGSKKPLEYSEEAHDPSPNKPEAPGSLPALDQLNLSSRDQEVISKIIESRVQDIVNQKLEELVEKKLQESMTNFISNIASNPSFIQSVHLAASSLTMNPFILSPFSHHPSHFPPSSPKSENPKELHRKNSPHQKEHFEAHKRDYVCELCHEKIGGAYMHCETCKTDYCQGCFKERGHKHRLKRIERELAVNIHHKSQVIKGAIIREEQTNPRKIHPKITEVEKIVIIKNTGEVPWDDKCFISVDGAREPLDSIPPGKEFPFGAKVQNLGAPQQKITLQLFHENEPLCPPFVAHFENRIKEGFFKNMIQGFQPETQKKAKTISHQLQLNFEKTKIWVNQNPNLTVPQMTEVIFGNDILRKLLI